LSDAQKTLPSSRVFLWLWILEDQEHLPNGRYFAFGELLGKAPQVTKGACSRFGSSFVGIPSLRSCSVCPRRTDIHVLTALSPHPCGSAHCAKPAFSLHPSRDGCRLDWLCMKIKINSFPAKAGPTDRARIPVGLALAGKPLICFRCAPDLHTQKAQTPPIATWVQAERRSRSVGRAAWMRRELPPAMDGGWQRAHGARP
jgi:hypothetical protein